MDEERVKAALAAKRRGGAVVERLGGLQGMAARLTGGGLPREIRSLVEAAFSAEGFARLHLIQQKRGEIGALFVGHSEADWRRDIGTLLPRIAPSAEAACLALAHRPYQQGLTRKPFRSPRSPQTVADVRGRWLLGTTVLVGEYDADIRWIAEHAAHLAGWSGGTDIGWLLAGAIDAGGDSARDVLDVLRAATLGEHETARMGRHVTQALMSCSRPEAWELVERLLLAAQRQEGLRQAILESVDEAHPDAFRRMLRLIRDEHLTRFSSVVRAADSWFGFQWDGASAVKIDAILERVLLFLDDPSARAAALHEKDAETVYLALWSIAFEDVDAAIPPAIALLSSSSVEIRFAATHVLVQTLWTDALPPLVNMLGDADLRVAARALDAFASDATAHVDGTRLFDQLEALLARIPKRSKALDALVWPWWSRKLEKPAIASAMAENAAAVGHERMLPYVPELDPFRREAIVRRIAGLPARWDRKTERKKRSPSAAERGVVLDLLGDSSPDVREAAFAAMRTMPLQADEVDRLVDLLGRKPGDLRNGALQRLRALPDAALLAAADRLVSDPSDQRRLAGLELLRDAAEAKRAVADVRARMERYVSSRTSPTDAERAHVDAVVGGGADARHDVATRDDALGLVDPVAVRTWPAPRARRVELDTPGTRASLKALAELVLAHATTEIRAASGEARLLVESVQWDFGVRRQEDGTVRDDVPLAAVWRTWGEQRPASTRDADGLELLRALVADEESAPWKGSAVGKVAGLGSWSRGTRFLRGLLAWCVAWDPPRDGVAFLLDGLESSLAALTDDDYRRIVELARESRVYLSYTFDGKAPPAAFAKLATADRWLDELRWWRDIFPTSIQPAHAERLYGLLRAFEARSEGYGQLRVTLDDVLDAYRASAIGDADLVDLLVGRWSHHARSTLLREISARKAPRALREHPELLALVDRCRRRVVEVECQRGDRESAASGLALELRWTGGLDTVSRALPALGKSQLSRSVGWAVSTTSRQDTLSHLVLRSIPREEDTPEAFARWAREARVREARLIELVVYAPQWAAHVSHALGWPGLESAVWWVQAHTKDDRSWQLQELKEIWAAEVSERTPLSASDLTEGAVDVAWFMQAFTGLGAERWTALDAAAKYAASSAGHTRAQLFARAMAGQVTRDELLGRIDGSRHQDSVRALGLLPLAEGDAREEDILRRYTRLQAFRRQSRKFGAQRQQSEGRAVAIGLANLARTAGFRDPQRLQWAMERAAVADLAHGPVALTRGAVTLELFIDDDGVPALSVHKEGKPLRTLPAALKKDPEVEELKDRLRELKRQRSRVRDALEEAMCRGDRFGADELRTLLEHPILAPALSRVVFVGDGIAGYLDHEGRVLRDHTGARHALGHDEEVRIAHPHDLHARGDWSAWQRDCFRAERVQPFKQLFRELYPMTESERGTPRSRRYAGHQVNPRQALTLLGGRGWVARPEEGVSRTFHEAGLTVRLGFQETFYTPADIEGLTLEEVVFTPKGEWKELELGSIPARLFSEAMRDLDLVVSVAHRGGVDPEATASTVEMRAALVQETCALLGLANVEVQASHVMVRGELGSYAVQLGSAGVTVMPGTAIPIVAVHAQHRGRLFLPFADDDPRTAEVLAKVLLLARDREIRDPSILEWIRAAQGGAMA